MDASASHYLYIFLSRRVSNQRTKMTIQDHLTLQPIIYPQAPSFEPRVLMPNVMTCGSGPADHIKPKNNKNDNIRDTETSSYNKG